MPKTWEKKEISDAKKFGGKRTPRSGGFWSFPGDVKTDDFLIDSKTTDHKGYAITGKTWKKIESEALKSRKTPMLSLSLTNESVELVILDINDFAQIYERSKGEKL